MRALLERPPLWRRFGGTRLPLVRRFCPARPSLARASQLPLDAWPPLGVAARSRRRMGTIKEAVQKAMASPPRRRFGSSLRASARNSAPLQMFSG